MKTLNDAKGEGFPIPWLALDGWIGQARSMEDLLYARANALLEAEVDDEIVALDREQGQVFGFNGVASDVWRLLEQPRTLSELCGELAETYSVDDAQCRGDVVALLDELIEMNLVKRIREAG